MATKIKSRVRFQERAELLDFLLEVSAITSETLDLDRLLKNVADIVRRVIPHELFAILLYNERLKALRIRHAVGHREEVVQNLLIPLGEGITGVAARERRPVVVSDVREERNYLNAMDAVRSELAVPMVARHKLVGVIDLQSTATGAFSAQDRALLQLIAGRVGAAIDNARLYRRVDRQGRTQRTLTLLAQEFSSILRLDTLLEEIAKSMHTLINYDAFVILQVDQPAGQLRSLFSLRYDQRMQLESLPMDQGITGAAASSGQPVLSRDTLSDPRYVESHPGIRSEVAVPLIVKDRVIGVMDLESSHVGAFTEDHVRTLKLIAPQIAIALENARLYEELERREKAMQQDLEAARQLQNVLLPPHPTLAGIDAGIGYKQRRRLRFCRLRRRILHGRLRRLQRQGRRGGALRSAVQRARAQHRAPPAQPGLIAGGVERGAHGAAGRGPLRNPAGHVLAVAGTPFHHRQRRLDHTLDLPRRRAPQPAGLGPARRSAGTRRVRRNRLLRRAGRRDSALLGRRFGPARRDRRDLWGQPAGAVFHFGRRASRG